MNPRRAEINEDACTVITYKRLSKFFLADRIPELQYIPVYTYVLQKVMYPF